MPYSPTLMQRVRRRLCGWHSCGVLAEAANSTTTCLRVVLVAIVVWAGCCSAVLMAQEEQQETADVTVDDIRIEGNETIPESVILQKIQAQPKRAISERLIREDKRSLMSTRWFFSVTERIDDTPQGLILVFKVHERPIVQRVEFRGNTKIKKKHLTAWTGLKAGSPYDYIANREAVHRIEQEYKDKGYFFVKVKLEKGGQPGERDVVFVIQEGPKVQVKHRTFEGNRFWGDGDLRKNLVSKQALVMIFGGLYNPDTIPADIEAVKQYYRAVGFFDVEVTAKPLFSDDRSDVNLHYSVTEGRRYAVREIRFEGNQIIATGQLKTDSKLMPGDKFSSYPLSKDVTRMLGYYGELGHYFASVNPVPHFTEQEGIVDLVFEIDEDRPRYVRDVNVAYDGDYPHTKQTVVLDRIQVQPGDLANPKMIRRGKSRLNGSGLFEPGIAFDVQPVEPEQSSFANASRTIRGQGPAESPDDWTQRFAVATHRSASDSLIGSYDWNASPATNEPTEPEPGFDEFEPEEVQPESDINDSSSAQWETGTRTESLSNDTAERVIGSGAISGLKPARPSLPRTYVSARLTNSSQPTAADAEAPILMTTQTPVFPKIGHSFGQPQSGENSVAGVFGAEVLQPHFAAENTSDHFASRPVTESEFAGFRSVDPNCLFSATVQTFVASENIEESDQPIFRAQSADPVTRDPAMPGYRDPVLEGSPYRNQFQAIPPGWVDINVNATEGRTGRLMFGAGVNSDAGVVGSFVWDESNFDLFRPPTSFADIIEGRAWRGGGQRFRAEAAPGNTVSRYAISWTDPYFMYTDFSLGISGFYFNRFYPDWQENRTGGRVSLGRQWTPEWSSAVALRLEDVELLRPRTATPPAIIAKALGSSFLSTVRVSATHDTRDQSVMPSEGHYFDAAYEQAFGDFSYPKTEAEFRKYFTLHNRPDGSGRQVLTLAGNVGWSGSDTPVFERYFAGGFQSFRGFAYRGVTPRDATGNYGVGGTFQVLGTVEYRVPVTADDMINVVAFSDFGTVETEVSVADFRATAGFGLRVVIPAMGPVPLAFDFAFPIRSQKFDNERMFSFYVGINR